jgi:hypothetical protein
VNKNSFRYAGAVVYRKYQVLHYEDLVALTLPAAMYLIGGCDFKETIITWLIVYHLSCLIFTLTTLHAAHHHPENFHDGDAPRYSFGDILSNCSSNCFYFSGKIVIGAYINCTPIWIGSISTILCSRS